MTDTGDPTLKQAMILYQRRKRIVASNTEDNELGFSTNVGEDGARKLLLGTGLTLEEVREGAAHTLKVITAIMALESDKLNMLEAMASAWVDGLTTGLILADLRQKEDLRRKYDESGERDLRRDG